MKFRIEIDSNISTRAHTCTHTQTHTRIHFDVYTQFVMKFSESEKRTINFLRRKRKQFQSAYELQIHQTFTNTHKHTSKYTHLHKQSSFHTDKNTYTNKLAIKWIHDKWFSVKAFFCCCWLRSVMCRNKCNKYFKSLILNLVIKMIRWC